MVEKKRLNSRQKGAGGEREFAEFVRSFGFMARRGRQYSGRDDAPDVIVESIPGIHWEVKRVQQVSIQNWLNQSAGDAGNRIPVVAHRRNGEKWKITLYADTFFEAFVSAYLKNLTDG